jgi:predicted dehydrogenase
MKIGILSFAHMHAESYAEALWRLPGVRLAGLWDADAARANHMARRFASATFAAPEALLDQGLDGVIICSENAHHRALVELSAPRVPYLLCEKPLATSREDAEAMLAACAAAGAKLMTAFPVRFAPSVRRLKALLDEGALGRVIAVSATNHGRMPGGWFMDASLAGGGAVIDHTVHVADLLRWFWRTEFEEVYAEVGFGLVHPGVSIDDAGLLSFTLKNGVYGTLDTSWSRPANYPTWGDVKLELLGEAGQARVDVFRQYLTLTSQKSGKTSYLPWGSSADLGLIESFVRAIREGGEPEVSGTDGLKALEVALAAYRSAEAQAPVRVGA